MKIRVTAEDIEHGVKALPNKCPIALAIKRATGRNDVMVGWGRWGYADVDKRDWIAWWYLTSAMDDFLFKFDTGMPVTPQEFVL